LQGIIGPKGATGERGIDGVQGIQGIQGERGEQGIQGLQGIQGVQGIQGEQGEPGEQGEKGDTGARGATGHQGEQGIQGEQGEKGDKGAIGPTGATGEKGEAGQVGAIDGAYDSIEELIAAHPTGNIGDMYYIKPDLYVWDPVSSSWLNIGEIAGPMGPTGPTGATGVTGATGASGIQGLQGLQGEQGEKGDTGATGATGSAGHTGATGPQGSQGVQGEQGLQGLQGEQGPQGIQGERGEKGEQGATGECDCGYLEDRIAALEQFIYYSGVTQVLSEDPALSDSGMAVIQSGYTYNFWGVGNLDHQQSLENGRDYYIATSDQYPELKKYQGEPTIGTVWIVNPAGDVVESLPVKFDSTGIYFTPDNSINNLPAGTSFKFTQTLILTD
jgi:hypothetical protein